MSTSMPIPIHPEAIDFIEELVREHTRNHIGHCGGDSLPRLRFCFEFWTYFKGRGYSEQNFSPEGFESLTRLDNFRLYRDLMNDVCNRRRKQLEDLDLESDLRSDPYLPETGECLQGQLRFLRKFQDAVNSNPNEEKS